MSTTSISSCSNLLQAVAPSRVKVRPWHQEDTSKINSLYGDPSVWHDAAEHRPLPRTEQQWEWEFAAGSPNPPAYFVAEQAGQIIGLHGLIPIELLHDGRLVGSGKIGDTLVHPDHQDRGVLDALDRHLFERASQDGIAALWGFTSPGAPAMRPNGYHSIGTFEAMRARLAPASHPLSGPRGNAELTDISIQTLVRPDERCDAFSLEFGQYAGGITLHLSSRFLRRRILANPYRRYAILAAFYGEKIVGLAIFTLDDPRKIGIVSELAAIPAESNEAESLLSALLREGLALFRKMGLRTAEARFSSPHPYSARIRRVLASWGFRPASVSEAPEFSVRPIDGHCDDWLDMEKWRISELMQMK